jgi:hypothetical protein
MEAGAGGYYRLKVRFVEFCLEVRFTHFRCVGAKRGASDMTLVTVGLGEMRSVSSMKYSSFHGQVVTIMKVYCLIWLGEWDYDHKDFEVPMLMSKKSAWPITSVMR